MRVSAGRVSWKAARTERVMDRLSRTSQRRAAEAVSRVDIAANYR
jgi:hypothetical protein